MLSGNGTPAAFTDIPSDRELLCDLRDGHRRKTGTSVVVRRLSH